MDKCASLRATKRSSYHEKSLTELVSSCSRERGSVRHEIYELRSSQPEGFIAATETGLVPHSSSRSTLLQETGSLSGHLVFVQSREISLCVQDRQTLLYVGDQHRTQPLVCTHHLPTGSSRTVRNSQNPVMCSPQG